MMVALVFLIVCLTGAVWLIRRGHTLRGVLVWLGASGFFGAAALPAAGSWLRYVELPPFFETTSIAGPEGRTFAATTPLGRIQRYDGHGRFEAGWFVHSAGGSFTIGLTENGLIAVAALRTRRVEFFNPDGSSAGPPRPFTSSGNALTVADGVLRPSNCQIEGVVFVDPKRVKNPPAHAATLLLFPLWNPLVAWLLPAVASLMTPGPWIRRWPTRDAASPLS